MIPFARASATYSSPIAVNTGTVTIKAKAFKSGMTDSATASATYTIGECARVHPGAHIFTAPQGSKSSQEAPRQSARIGLYDHS
jgi:chitinase